MTVAALAEAAGSSLQELATALDLRLEFLVNVDTGFQPLPLDLVAAIANVLGLERNEVRASVLRLTTVTSLRARQPRPLTINRAARAVRLARTQPVLAQESFSPTTVLGQQIFGHYRSDFGVTVPAAQVTAWLDRSANNDLAEAALGPVYVNDGSGVNGLPFLTFDDAVNAHLDFPGGGIAGTSELSWTFIFAVDVAAINGVNERCLFDVNSGGASVFAVANEIDVGTTLGYFNNATWTGVAAASTGMQVLAFVFDEGAAEVRVFRDKVLLGTGVYVPFDITPGAAVQVLGGSLPSLGGFRSHDGDLYEAAMYGEPLDTSTPDEWDRLHDDYFLPRYSLP